MLSNIIVFMGKPRRGSRPIALMPMLYRVWTRVRRKYIDDWEKGAAGGWDAAVKGSSALRASILSQMRDEIAVAKGGRHPHGIMGHGEVLRQYLHCQTD